ncbi:hypothetical protein BVG19_g4676 [[Candida] boidinii]|nr:hypothetical protein BVG19_g4676 [[Candida] boidinii]OWB53260.1 hypothetical protein B5S27_g4853 [[Candida] boidinii]OWB86536.1 hypothetical protein B5S33_g5235 [[Candida] boidinii]
MFNVRSLVSILLLSSSVIKSVSSADSSNRWSNQANVLEYQNLGYEGSFRLVSSIDSKNDSCTCVLNEDTVPFSGTNSPFDGEVSVHIRGPINLQKFAFFTTDSYSSSDSSSNSSWTRRAYYDSASSSAENVTFLGNVGDYVQCLGHALQYVDEDATSASTESKVIDDVTIHSNEEFIIMSNLTCESSGWGKNCGVYRDGIPAYHGYDGTTKMFLFQFEAPMEDDSTMTVNNTASYNMPAIWLLNAHIPRTAQYPYNPNCSCWNSGCGEFDIFEVLNNTESTHFFTTIHDYQGTDDIEGGLPIYGWLERTPNQVMKGGVVFDSNGVATVFISSDTTFDDNLSSTDLSNWISSATSNSSTGVSEADEVDVRTLATVTAASTSSSKGDAAPQFLLLNGGNNSYWTLFSTTLLCAFFSLF